jgi:hypothetical protein
MCLRNGTEKGECAFGSKVDMDYQVSPDHFKK